MELAFSDWAVIIVFLFISFGIGVYFTGRASKGLAAFFLGGRNLPWWIAGVSMVATTFAADTPLAVTELVAQDGIAGNWVWWSFLAGGMLTTFFFAKLWRRSGILTDVEFIELRYSGKEAAFLRGLKAIYLGLFMNSLIIGWVNLALMAILQVFFHIPDETALLYVGGAMVVTMVYSSLSGLLGVAINDFFQFFIAMAGTIILAVLVVSSEQIGGTTGLKEQLEEIAPAALNFFPRIGTETNVQDTVEVFTLSLGAFLAMAGMQWWASWYPGAEPGGGGYIAQRMLSTKNEKHAIISTFFFQIAHYCIRPWPWILVGLSALILYPELDEDSKRLGYVMAMRDFLPAGLKGLLLAAFLAAYMSTISTQLNWGASYLVKDFYSRFISAETDFSSDASANKNYLFISRLATVFIMLVALIITGFIETISGVWLFIIEGGAGLGLVLILRWYWWRVNAWSELAATIIPLFILAIIRLLAHFVTTGAIEPGSGMANFVTNYSTHPQSFFLILGTTTLGWLLVTYLTKPTDMAVLKTFYEKIRPMGAWKPVEKILNKKQEKHALSYLVVCWLSAILFCYSILFIIGRMIFQQWDEVWPLLIVIIVSLTVLTILSRKIKIFED
ncbi:sodium:solute symporter family protein [Cytophagaceae bacterium ABcell3]|nr:sodium:solute symporter family protein [Cytophagaceae bacterium ABcell3]